MAIYIFYDSFSKMYLIYTTLCYAIIILHFADVETLSPILRKAGNDGLSRNRKVVIRDKDKQLRGSYHVESTKDKSIELIVDDLVEKVKDRLKSELKMITSSQGLIAKPQLEEDVNPREEIAAERKKKLQIAKLQQDKLIKPTYLPLSQLEAGYELTDEPTGQNSGPKIAVSKIKRKTTTPDTRYLAEVFTAKPPKYLLEYGPPKLLKNPTTLDPNIVVKKKEKTLTTEDIETVTETTPLTTEDTGSFVGFDLVNTNDSYEDYVTPKKDLDYKEPESQKSGFEIGNKGREIKYKNRQKLLGDFEKANQVMVKSQNRGSIDEYKIEDSVIYEQKMLGDFDRANNAMFEYEKAGQKTPTKNQQKALDDFYRAKQLMSKIKKLNNVGKEKLKSVNIKDPETSDSVKLKDNSINEDRERELLNSKIQISNIEMEVKPYLEQLKYLEDNKENADDKKATDKNLFESIKIINKDQEYEDNDDETQKQIEESGVEMTGPILRARKHVDALVEDTQPDILKRRKSFDTLYATDSNADETSEDDDFEVITINKLFKRILGNVPMKNTKIYFIKLAQDKL